MNSLYPAYHHKDPCMGQSLSPLSGSGLASIHTSQAGIPPYAHPGAAIPGEKMLTPSGFEAHHPAMLGRHTEQHMSSSAGMVQINGLHHHPHAHLGAQGHGQGLGNGREQASGHGQQGAGGGVGVSGGQMEEVNTKEVAQRITTELKRYSIPQAIFAQRVLCRSQGTLSDLLRNPKPWSKLKSGRETFRRMWKWLQEPEFQRMSALRLAGERSLGKAPFWFSPLNVVSRLGAGSLAPNATVDYIKRDGNKFRFMLFFFLRYFARPKTLVLFLNVTVALGTNVPPKTDRTTSCVQLFLEMACFIKKEEEIIP